MHDYCFFFNDTATTEIYTLSLHDALPISQKMTAHRGRQSGARRRVFDDTMHGACVQRTAFAGPEHRIIVARLAAQRSEEHTSELQSRQYLVCRLLLEKKKTNTTKNIKYYI